MRLSNFFIATLKEAPKDAEVISHQLMIRAGLIRKLASGLYTWLPLGLRILRKVEKIIHEEMHHIQAQEVLMPAIQPAELWQETNRWEKFGPQLLKIIDRHKREFCFGPTHEEVITDLVRGELKSYKQLPLTLYQIQTKFRDEIRPRFGVMRAREFLMKDAYSFHLDTKSLQDTYEKFYAAYTNIFTRLGLKFRAVLADTGSIGGSLSHEFHVLAETGEDQLVYSNASDYAANIEMLPGVAAGDQSPDGQGTLEFARGIEVGHIFQLGDKYSQAMNATVLDETGKARALIMGCYGIGVSRIVAAAIEQYHDNKGIIWPDAMAPFQVIIIPIGYHQSQAVKKAANTLYQDLKTRGIEVALDDRPERPGVMFSDAELIGIPKRVVISEKLLQDNQVEFKKRELEEVELISLVQLHDILFTY